MRLVVIKKQGVAEKRQGEEERERHRRRQEKQQQHQKWFVFLEALLLSSMLP
jgi:hypothetical protein